jgi:primosomal protein DnaI
MKQESAKRNPLIKTLYMPSSILDATLESYDTNCDSRKKIYKHIVEYNENTKKGLYLYGSFAKGKTYSLAVIASALTKQKKESLLIYFPDLVLDLKNALGTPRFEDLVNMLKSVDILMLDDLGAENITPWIRDEILGPVINYRVLAEKPLYISSNINPKDLINHLSIDNLPNSKLKAERIVTRMQSLVSSIDMDDSKMYKR